MRRIISVLLILVLVLALALPFGEVALHALGEPIAIMVEQNGFDVNNVGGDAVNTLLWRKGNAITVGGRIQLTNSSQQAGSVVKRNQVKLVDGFSTYFQMYFSGAADGIAFVIYKADTPQLGDNGGALGYGDQPSSAGDNAIHDSIAVEFDTWNNGDFDQGLPAGDHVAIMFDGNQVHASQSDGGVAKRAAFLQYQTINAWVDYDATHGTVTVTYGVSTDKALGSTVTRAVQSGDRVPHAGDDVFIGFTSSTGNNATTHELLKWYFQDTYEPAGLNPAAGSYSQAASTVGIVLKRGSTVTSTGADSATITVNDASGVPMINQGFDVYIDDVKQAGLFNTGESASYSYSLPSSLGVGNHSIRAVASGGASNFAAFTVLEQCTVTYNGNGHTGGSVPAAAVRDVGALVTVAANTGGLTRTGYAFMGWNTAPDGSGYLYQAGSTVISVTSDITLYAMWKGFSTSGGTSTFVQPGTPVAVDPSISLEGFSENLTGATVMIQNYCVGDQLLYTAMHGIVGVYDSAGGVLRLSGSAPAAAYQEALRSVTFSTTSPDRTLRSIDFSIGSILYFSGNGHYYEYVQGLLTWTAARDAATLRDYYGMQGYLATITSAAENAFIQQRLQADAWIGCSDSAVEGEWRWVTGPEAGTLFSRGNNYPVPEAGRYMNWNSGEPNDSAGEDYGEIYSSGSYPGKWNDLAGTTNPNVKGYVVEYGGMPADAPISLMATKTVRIIALPSAPRNVTAVAGNQQATVSFDLPADDGNAAITQYVVTASPGGVTATGNSSSITVTGLSHQAYTFTVKAINAAGEGATSAASNAVTVYTLVNVSYDANGATDGTPPVDATTYHSGDTVNVLGNTGGLERIGYTFGGWNTAASGGGDDVEGSFVIGASGVSLYARWVPKTNTAYKVEHYQQDAVGDGYTLIDTDTLSGTTAVPVVAVARSYTGFTENTHHAERAASGSIAPGGTLVLKLYYDITLITVTFRDYDGSFLGSETVRYGGTAPLPPAPSRVGYTFAGWSGTYGDVTSNQTVTATYTANTDTAYQVEHYLQDVTGSAYVLQNTENLTGTTAAIATATSGSYIGFHENIAYASRIASGQIAANGTLVLKLYYDRDTFTVRFVDHDGSEIARETVRYQGAASPPAAPTRTGYAFAGWSGTYTDITAAQVVSATYTANSDTSYRVAHYLQDVTGPGYTLMVTDNLTGVTDTNATASANTYPGFHENTTHASRISSGVIAPDGSLMLKLYYDRDMVVVTFVDHDGDALASRTVRFGGTAELPAEPTRIGYTFAGWSGTYGNVAADQTVTATYTANADTAYQVEHYLQDVTGPGYTLTVTDSRTGTTAATATAVANMYVGFHESVAHAGRVASGAIAPDGSLVLRLYYDRDTFTVRFLDHDGASLENVTVRYQGTALLPGDPTRLGYTFSGWTGTYSDIAGDQIVTATYAANSNTVHRVEHYWQDVSGSGYTLKDTDNQIGTTGTLATAAAKAYPGFSENTTHVSRLAAGNIAPDGSLVLKLYYDRHTFNVTFVDHDGRVLESTTVRYLGTAALPVTPVRLGYAFAAWSGAYSNVASNQTVTATYSPNVDTAYLVRHYLQNVTGPGYTLQDTEHLSGTTDTVATAAVKTYPGFGENTAHGSRVASGNITADGSLELQLYYDRQLVTMTFRDDAGNVFGSQTVRYADQVARPADPSRAGLTFVGWYTDSGYGTVYDFGGASVTADTDIYAKWINLGPNGSISINGGSAITNSAYLNLEVAAIDPEGDAVSQMCFSNDGVNWTDWEAFATSTSYTLPIGDGAKTVHVKFRDVVGSEGPASDASIVLDTMPPNISGVSDGDMRNTDVTPSFTEGTATLAWNGGSNSAFISGSTISAEGEYSLVLTDAAGNSLTKRFTIDKTVPTGMIVINAGDTYAISSHAAIAITYSDGAGVGVAKMRFSNDGTTWSAWETAAASKHWVMADAYGPVTVFMQLMDGASNVSLSISDSIQHKSIPVVSNCTRQGTEDTGLTLTKDDFLFSNADGSALTKVLIIALPSHGALQSHGANVTLSQEISATDLDSLVFIPDSDWNGATSITWKGSDGVNYSSLSATITLEIAAVNDAPIAAPGSLTTNAGAVGSGSLSATDIDADSLVYSIVTQGSKGTVTLIDAGTGAYVYTPDDGAFGSDSFSFRVNDGLTDSNTASVQVDIIPSGVADLSALSVSAGSLDPAFAVNAMDYSLQVGNEVAELTVSADTSDIHATLSIDGSTPDLVAGSYQRTLSLAVGNNVIDLEVTAQDGTTRKTYHLTVNRAPSSNAALATVDLGAVSVYPAFAADTLSYTSSVAYERNRITLTAVAADSTATISVNGTPLSSGGLMVTLQVGRNVFSVKVMAEDGVTERIYTFVIFRDEEEEVRSTPVASGVDVLVNGKSETAATATTEQVGGLSVTTVTVDDAKVGAKLQAVGNNAVVTLPVTGGADVVVGRLTGATVKNMESRAATLEMVTDRATYTLPAAQINIDEVGAQLGENVSLQDISVQVQISQSPAERVELVEDAAKRGNYLLIVPPVDFSISCTYGEQTVSVSRFNAYVERSIAIPQGVDPSKVTTAAVLQPDGTLLHVPTRVTIIDGKYYAKVNSLTNSTYSLIWNQVEFADLARHWAKAAVNDMGSRMVMTGDSADSFGANRPITRAEFAVTIVKALGLAPSSGVSPFLDVLTGEEHFGYMLTAYDRGIMGGFPGDLFGPDRLLTREEAMAIVVAAMRLTGLPHDLAPGETEAILATYVDGEKVGAWARNVVAACLKTGIIGGRPGQVIAPRDSVTKAEIAAIVQRLLRRSGLI